jgi:hypothetical protein
MRGNPKMTRRPAPGAILSRELPPFIRIAFRRAITGKERATVKI